MPVVLIVVLVAVALIAALAWRAVRAAKRADFIRSFVLPRGLFDKLREKHPQLSLKDCQLVAQALRQFFLAYQQSGGRPVSMPSQVVDDLWHEFILHTRNYEAFCRRAFGRFLHHTPATAMGGERRSNAGLRRCWWHCCRAENIDPRQPTRLPLLFAIDGKLAIAGGFRYVPDCGPLKARTSDGDGGTVVIHCGAEFGDASIDGSTEGFGDGASGAGSDSGGGGDGGGGGCSS